MTHSVIYRFTRNGILALLLLLTAAAPALAAGSIEVGVLRFRVPMAWQQIPAAGLRAAAFEIPTVHGPAIVTFDRFADSDADAVAGTWPGLFDGGSGTVELRRWTDRIAGFPVRLGDFRGIWRGEESLASNETVMRAVLFESRRGLVQVRLVGPPAAVEAAMPGFMSVVRKAVDAWQP